MLKSKYIGLLFLVLAILMACQYPSPVTLSGDRPQKKRDSVNYLMERHYTLNSNFEVTSDSLMLQQLPLVDVLPVFKGERLVVAEFMIQPADSVDSVWVKVARDQETMGWVHEKELLEKVVPVDSVSQFIHFFSNSHTIAFFIILGFFYQWYGKELVFWSEGLVCGTKYIIFKFCNNEGTFFFPSGHWNDFVFYGYLSGEDSDAVASTLKRNGCCISPVHSGQFF